MYMNLTVPQSQKIQRVHFCFLRCSFLTKYLFMAHMELECGSLHYDMLIISSETVSTTPLKTMVLAMTTSEILRLH